MTGQYNVATGYGALNGNTDGFGNVANGYRALYTNNSGYDNVALGYRALYSNTYGDSSVAIGTDALYTNTSGYYNVAIGYSSMYYNTTGYSNTAIGISSLNRNTTGAQNTAVGLAASTRNTTGGFNTALGFYALNQNTTGSNNTVLGHSAGEGSFGVSNFSNNTLIGMYAGKFLQTAGSNNVIVGAFNAQNLQTGAKNIIIGYDIELPTSSTSNSLNIGNILFGNGMTGVDSTIVGNIGIGLNNPAYRFDVLQNTAAQTASNRVANVANTGATFDTTAGALSSYGGYFSSTSTRSAGANDLTNVGLYATASGAQQNNAAIFDQGNVGIGTTTPTAKLAISDTVTPTGPELVTNGTFTGDASGWTLNDCGVYGSNQVTVTYTACTNPRISTTVATVSGSTYLVTFTVSGSTGKVQFYFSNNWQVFDYGPFKDGTYTVALKATYTGNDTLYIGLWDYQETNSTWTVDNVSIKEVLSPIAPLVVGTGFTGKKTISVGSVENNVTFGLGALSSITTGTDNIAIGSSSLFSNTTGGYNTAVGRSSLMFNISGDSNTGLGYYALRLNTTGGNNTAVGNQALRGNTTGNGNTAVGDRSLLSSSTGYQNTAIGESALNSNTTGYQNTGLGRMAMVLNTTGNLNTGVGYGGLYSNISGLGNTGIGQMALYGNRTGSYNTVLGSEAGYGAFNNNMSNNTFVGYRAGYNIRSNGNNNVLIGYQAADNLTTGAKNIVIGHDIDITTITGSNQLNIGNIIFGTGVSGTGTTIAGSIGIATTSPISGAVFDVNGNTIFSGTDRYLNFGTTSGTTGYGIRDNAGVLEVKNSGGVWAGLGGWGLTGNTGTNSSTNFLGTTDAQALVLRTNNTEKLRILTDGNVGIGTSTPTAKLGIGFVDGFSSYQFFYGTTGLDDGVFSGTYTGGVANSISVVIDSTGTPDTFSWSDNNAECAGGSNVPITGGLQLLCNGIGITFGATTGHTNGTAWIYVYENEQAIVQARKNNVNYINIKTNRIGIGKNAGENTGASRSVFIGEETGKGAFGISDVVFLGYNSGVNASTASSATFVGNTAGYGAVFAEYSSFVGSGAGAGATNAYYSQFMGASAGALATDASGAVFIGHVAGENAANSSGAVFIGSNAGAGATSATRSAFLGVSAGAGATNATYSNFFGYYSGRLATNVSYSNLFGFNTGSFFTGNNIGSNNIIIGTNISLPNATANAINIGGVLFGTGTYATTTGNPSVTAISGGRIGIGAVSPVATLDINGDTIISGSNRYLNFGTTSGTTGYGIRDNAGVLEVKNSGGAWAGLGGWGLTGNAGTNSSTNFIGTTDGQDLSFRRNNVFAGSIQATSLFLGVDSLNTASFSTAIGARALGAATIFSGIGLGYQAGYGATSSNYGTFIGENSGYNAVGLSQSISLGYYSGSGVTSSSNGSINIGSYSGQDSASSASSIGIGESAKKEVSNSFGSVFIGTSAGQRSQNSSYSIMLGYQAGRRNNGSHGTDNIGIGSNVYFYQSGNPVALGNNNIVLGNYLTVPASTNNFMNLGSVVFAKNTYSTLSGDPSSSPSSTGLVGILNNNPSYTLQVGNSGVSGIVARFENSTGTCDINPTTTSLVCSSDINLKKNITIIGTETVFTLSPDLATTSYDSMLKKLTALTPVVYNWNAETGTDMKHAGFIAQEVEQLFPDLVTVDPITGYRSLGYAGLIPYTISALKELDIAVTDITSLTETTPLRVSLVAWLGDVANGINQLFAKEVKTEKLCITDANGEVCITKDQLYQVLQGNVSGQGGGSTTQESTTDSNTNDGDVPVDNGDEQAPEEVPEVVTTPDDTVVPNDQPSEPEEVTPLE